MEGTASSGASDDPRCPRGSQPTRDQVRYQLGGQQDGRDSVQQSPFNYGWTNLNFDVATSVSARPRLPAAAPLPAAGDQPLRAARPSMAAGYTYAGDSVARVLQPACLINQAGTVRQHPLWSANPAATAGRSTFGLGQRVTGPPGLEPRPTTLPNVAQAQPRPQWTARQPMGTPAPATARTVYAMDAMVEAVTSPPEMASLHTLQPMALEAVSRSQHHQWTAHPLAPSMQTTGSSAFALGGGVGGPQATQADMAPRLTLYSMAQAPTRPPQWPARPMGTAAADTVWSPPEMASLRPMAPDAAQRPPWTAPPMAPAVTATARSAYGMVPGTRTGRDLPYNTASGNAVPTQHEAGQTVSRLPFQMENLCSTESFDVASAYNYLQAMDQTTMGHDVSANPAPPWFDDSFLRSVPPPESFPARRTTVAQQQRQRQRHLVSPEDYAFPDCCRVPYQELMRYRERRRLPKSPTPPPPAPLHPVRQHRIPTPPPKSGTSSGRSSPRLGDDESTKFIIHAVPAPHAPQMSLPAWPAVESSDVQLMSCAYTWPDRADPTCIYLVELLLAGEIVPFEVFCEIDKARPVKVFWFPYGYNQNVVHGRFRPDGTLTSNACTIIAVLLASYVELTVHSVKRLSKPHHHKDTIALFMATMREANRIHHTLASNGMLSQRLNVTIPEACRAIQQERKALKELFFTQKEVGKRNFGELLCKEIRKATRRFYGLFPVPHTPRNLYLVLIVDQRSMLLILQTDTALMTMFDPHCYSPHGALIAQAAEGDLYSFCRWYHRRVVDEWYPKPPGKFELSCLVSQAFNDAVRRGFSVADLHPPLPAARDTRAGGDGVRRRLCPGLSVPSLPSRGPAPPTDEPPVAQGRLRYPPPAALLGAHLSRDRCRCRRRPGRRRSVCF